MNLDEISRQAEFMVNRDDGVDQGYQSNYPDPVAPYHLFQTTPYPSLTTSGSDQLSAQNQFQDAVIDNGLLGTPGPTVHEGFIPLPKEPSMSDVAAQYQSLADAFHVRNGDPGQQIGYYFNRERNRIEYESDVEGHVEESEVEGVFMPNEFLALGSKVANDFERDPNFELDVAEESRSDDDISVDGDFPEDAPTIESGRGRQGPLRGGRQGRGRGRGGGRGRRGWKWALKGTSHDPMLDKTAPPRGRPKGSAVGSRRGGRRKKEVNPGPDFRQHQTEAMEHWQKGEDDLAMESVQAAIQANPEVFAAHSLFADILEKKGRDWDAIAVLISGANTKRDPELWAMLGDRTLDAAGDQPTSPQIEQAIMCYSMALKLKPDNYAVREEKRDLHLALGDKAKARYDSKNMLRFGPADLYNVKLYTELCAETFDAEEIRRARRAYDNAFAYYQKKDEIKLLNDELKWSHLNIYLELFHRAGIAAEAVFQLKRLARWYLGRRAEDYWDRYTSDDREWDCDDERRAEVPEFNNLERPDSTRYGDGLPLELRIKLGLFRLKMGAPFQEEALAHLDHLLRLKDQVDQLEDLFIEVGTEFRAQGLHENAIEFLAPASTVPRAQKEPFYMALADSYIRLERVGDAERCYKAAAERDEMDFRSRVELAKLYEKAGRHEEARQRSDEVIRLGRLDLIDREMLRTKAIPTARQARPSPPSLPSIPSPAPFVPAGEGAFSKFKADGQLWPAARRKLLKTPNSAKARKVTDPEKRLNYLRERDARISANYDMLQRLRSEVNAANEDAITQWMGCAGSMVDDFRSMHVFYPAKDKHMPFKGYRRRLRGEKDMVNEMEAMKNRLQDDVDSDEENDRDAGYDDTIPKDFHSILFTEWHDIMIELGLHHARRGNDREANAVLEAAEQANVFWHDTAMHTTALAARMAVGFMSDDDALLCRVARDFIGPERFGKLAAGMPYQLLGAVNRLFSGNGRHFNSGPTQKFLLRAVKNIDYALLDEQTRERFAFSFRDREGWTKNQYRNSGLHDLDAGLLTLYGHMMAETASYKSALNYYLRALTLQPDNISLNLCIATAYVQHGMKRQTENRHFEIHQGLSFLYRSYDLRAASGKAVDRQEAEFNVGRMWHLLGLTNLALPAYERCLALSAQVKSERGFGESKSEVEDFAKEAAFAVQMIMALNGDLGGAKGIGERWLVID